MIHRLKTWPSFFNAVVTGHKLFEVRYAEDRDFAVGDYLVLAEYNPTTEKFTGNEFVVSVTFVLQGGRFGVLDEYVAMSLKHVHPSVSQEILKEAGKRRG